MNAHTLTIRPSPHWKHDGFVKVCDLEVLLDHKRLEGLERIEIMPLDAFGGLIQVKLHMVVNPDWELPIEVIEKV